MKNKKISLKIYFLELSEEFLGTQKNEFELAMVNEPLVFELLRFDYILNFEQLHFTTYLCV